MGYMGGYYVDNKYAYEMVEAQAVSTYNTEIPSSATVIEGCYYIWDEDSGFTGSGWKTDIEGSPTNIYNFSEYEGDTTEEKVTSYVKEVGDLNAVFANWEPVYTMEHWDNFYQSIPIGCKERT